MIINHNLSTNYSKIAAALDKAWDIFQTKSSRKPDSETNERRRVRAGLRARYEAAHAAAKYLDEQGVDPGPFVQMQAVALDSHTRALARDAGDWARLEEETYCAEAEGFGLSDEDLELGLLVHLIKKTSPGDVSDAALRNFDQHFTWTWDHRRRYVQRRAAELAVRENEADQPAAPPEGSDGGPSKLKVIT